jgi:hypothetical protein
VNRTLVVVTRIGARMSSGSPLPSIPLTDKHLSIASRVASPALAQVTRPLHWAIVTSPQRADQVLDALDGWELHRPLPYLHVQGSEQFTAKLIPGEHFLTVRLDADDAWLPATLDRLPDDLPSNHALHFPNGWQIDTVSGKGCALSYTGHWTSPYLAIANDGRSNMLDIHEPHTSIEKVRTLVTDPAPAWLQLVGGWNTSNHFDRFSRGNLWPVKTILADAGLDFTNLAWDGPLDELAALHASDKGSAPGRGLFPKRYVPVYEHLLEPLRDQQCQIVEYGVYNGGSIRMWLDHLPKARVIGVDLRAAPRSIATNNRYTHVQGNQSLAETRDEVLRARKGPIDAIIDDCSHQTEDHRATYELMWPHLRPGGWYAIEDLHATPASVPWLKDLGAEFHCDNRLAVLHKP